MSEKAPKKAPAKKTGARRAAAKKTPSKTEKEEVAEEAVKTVVEQRPAPAPVVLVRHERGMQQRRARGFSLGELGSAGITFIAARRVRLPVDPRRRSVLDGNVGKLKDWYVPEPKKAASEKPEKAEKRPKKAPKTSRATKAKKE
jgi:ribosomal protein L13E